MTASTRSDRFARLRDGLAVYRAATTQATGIAWCVDCEVHQAPEVGGLCPVCAPPAGHEAAA